MRREPSQMRLDAGYDVSEELAVTQSADRTAPPIVKLTSRIARHSSQHKVADPNPRVQGPVNARHGWIGHSQLAPPRVETDGDRRLAALLNPLTAGSTAYSVAESTTSRFYDGKLLYELDEEDFDFCRRESVPLPVASRILVRLEVAYARHLLSLAASETALGRLFSEPHDVVTSARLTSPVSVLSPVSRDAKRQARPTICSTCTAPFDASSADREVSCAECGATAHKSCWCLLSPEVEPRWTCDRCQWVAWGRLPLHGGRLVSGGEKGTCLLCNTDIPAGVPQLAVSVKPRRGGGQSDSADSSRVPHAGWVHLPCAWIVEVAVIDAVRRRVIVDAPSNEVEKCHRCGGPSPANYLVRCAFGTCARVFHPHCVPAVEATRSLASNGVVDALFSTFCTEHAAARDLHNREYGSAGPLEQMSNDAEKAADASVLEDGSDPSDAPFHSRVAKHWICRRNARREWGANFIWGLDLDNRALVEAVGHPEIVRHVEDAVVRRSAVLSLIPELQLFLSRRLEPKLWTPLVFTEASLARYGLEPGSAVPEDRDATPALNGDGGRDPEAAALLRLKRIAASAALLTGIGENIKLRERTKQRLVAVEVAELRTRFGLNGSRRASLNTVATISELLEQQAAVAQAAADKAKSQKPKSRRRR